MTIDEAIKIKSKYQYILQDASFPELIEADNLSIEALKLVAQTRGHSISPVPKQLPGETPENYHPNTVQILKRLKESPEVSK